MLSRLFKDIGNACSSKVDCGIHEFHPDVGDFVSSGAGDSRDESMTSQQAKFPVDSGGMSFPFSRIVGDDDFQAHGQVRSPETLDEVFPAYDSLKERLVLFPEGVEAPDPLLGQFLRFTQAIQLPVGFGRIIDLRQGLKIGAVRPETDFRVSFQAVDSFGHLEPIDGPFSTTQSADTELPGTVDDRLDAQYNPMFVVHFEPRVGFEPTT